MSDRELLELAAKAAGIEFGLYHEAPSKLVKTQIGDAWVSWNPLADDGDALRLAVKCRIDLHTSPIGGEAVVVTAKHRMRSDILREQNPTHAAEEWKPNPYAATRRAIVRAAAAIGRTMP